jgi:Domain of unknown function (DUF6429)
MAIKTDRIDDCVLALLLLGRHDGQRVWKTFDWAAMERLYEKGLISDPVGRAKSVALTDEGLGKAERLFRDLFVTKP